MVTTQSLVNRLSDDYPLLTFTLTEGRCAWNPLANEVLYSADTAPTDILHEVGHALSGHKSYTSDVELLRMEREAWEYAVRTLAPQYGVTISEDTVETALDSYREWLHRRSLCPTCNLNGVQESRNTYRCVHCHKRWDVNEARTCRLKRTTIKNNPS